MRTDHDTRDPRPSTRRPSLRTGLPASRASSPRRFIVALALLAGIIFAPRAVRADITYMFQNYPADQQNYGARYSLTGQIVTDGATGNLSASDILSWTVTITNTATDQIYGAYGGGSSSVYIEGLIQATATQITIADPSEPALGTFTANEILFHAYPEFTMDYHRGWDYESARPRNPGPGTEVSDQYYQAEESITYWSEGNPAMGGTDPWVIASVASVPEPSTGLVAVFGSVSGIAYGLVRRAGHGHGPPRWALPGHRLSGGLPKSDRLAGGRPGSDPGRTGRTGLARVRRPRRRHFAWRGTVFRGPSRLARAWAPPGSPAGPFGRIREIRNSNTLVPADKTYAIRPHVARSTSQNHVGSKRQ